MSVLTIENVSSWLSIADLLSKKIPASKLVTAIETVGVQAYDRFDRRVDATEEGADSRVSKARVLNLLAKFHAEFNEPIPDRNLDPYRWFEWDSPLQSFGWLTDECPDFSTSENKVRVGSPEWRRNNAKKAADAKHDRPGGSREKYRKIRECWASGKYASRDICAEQECAALDMSFSSARKALRNTLNPIKDIAK